MKDFSVKREKEEKVDEKMKNKEENRTVQISLQWRDLASWHGDPVRSHFFGFS